MSVLSALAEASAPTAAVELAAHRVSAATIGVRGGQPFVSACAVEPLPPGVLVPSLTSQNLLNPDVVSSALGRVLERIGRPRRIGVVLPDLVAKVSLVRFEQVPARKEDLDQLVRWQVKKTAPFPADEAQVSYVPGAPSAAGHEFIVSLARQAVVTEYETLCARHGAHAGIVDIATFNVINAVLAGSPSPSGDWLLVNMAPDSASLAILRGSDLIFFRNRAADTEGTLADLVHQTAMYYEDRLAGGGFSRVMLAGAAEVDREGDAEEVRRNLQERLVASVETVDPRSAAALADRVAPDPALLDALTPLVGLLLRHREVAA